MSRNAVYELFDLDGPWVVPGWRERDANGAALRPRRDFRVPLEEHLDVGLEYEADVIVDAPVDARPMLVQGARAALGWS